MLRFTRLALLCATLFMLPTEAQEANLDQSTNSIAQESDNPAQFAFVDSGGGRITGCVADDAAVYAPPATFVEGGNDPLAACNNVGSRSSGKGAAQRAAAINPATSPGWSVVAGTVRSFSGRTGSRTYEYSVARVRHTSGATGILLSVQRANNPWDRRILREGDFKEFSPAILQYLKFSWGDLPDIGIEVVQCWLGDCGPIFSRLKNDIGPELAKLAIRAADAVLDALKYVAEEIIKFGSELSTILFGNLKKSADQASVNIYVQAVRDTRSTNWSLEMKVFEALRRTVADSSNPNTAQALAQTILDLK